MPSLNRAAFAKGAFFLAFTISHTAHAGIADLDRMTEKLDRLDQADFQVLIDKTESCTRARDFDCAEDNARKAGKLANSNSDKRVLADAKKRIGDERKQVEREAAEQRAAEEARQKLAAREALCSDYCSKAAQLEACVARRIVPQECDDANSQSASVNYAADINAALNQIKQSHARISGIHNQSMTNIQAAQAERQRAEQSVRIAQANSQTQQERERIAARQAEIQRQTERSKPTQITQAVPAESTRTLTANTGRRAMDCVSISQEKDDLAFHNNCNGPIFVVYCGELKYDKRRCGDGPVGNSFYTHSINIAAGGSTMVRGGNGNYRYAACEGSISFGKDEIQDRPDGSYTCVPRYKN